MNKTLEIELNRLEVDEIIKEHVRNLGHTPINLHYLTGVEGDYDKGTAKEYVKKLIIECEV